MTASAARGPIPLDDLLTDFEACVRPPLEDLLNRHDGASWVSQIDEWLADYDAAPELALSELDLVCVLIALKRCVAATVAAERRWQGAGRVRVGDRVLDLDIEGVQVATAALLSVAAIAGAAHPGRGQTILDKAADELPDLIAELGAHLRLPAEAFQGPDPIGPAH
jgi:hypothetical protein